MDKGFVLLHIFQCRSVLLIWIVVTLAEGAGGVYLDTHTLSGDRLTLFDILS